MPIVSVIIPLYNKRRFIRRAVDSVLNQTYRDLELIVVDDGSTDGGLDICSRMDDSRMRVIRQGNAGPGAARNKGIEGSRGKYLAFLDADDEWMPELLETCVNALEDNPTCGAAAASHYLGEARRDMTGVFRSYGMKDGLWRLDSNISDRELKYAVYIMHSSSTVARRDVITRYGGFYCRNRCLLGEDYYLWLQVMLNHPIYRIMRPLWWFHSEASELANTDALCRAMQPFLHEADDIRMACPPELAETLERWFAITALGIAHECSVEGNTEMASELVKLFPRMKRARWEYVKLRVKTGLPWLVPVVRQLKGVRHGHGNISGVTITTRSQSDADIPANA